MDSESSAQAENRNDAALDWVMDEQGEEFCNMLFELEALSAEHWEAVAGDGQSIIDKKDSEIAMWVGGIIVAKDAEIARLQAQLDAIRTAHDEAQSVLQILNPDSLVATFQIASYFQVMGNKVGVILNQEAGK